MEILDMKCAEYGNNIALIPNINEALITRSLGVLQEDGIYAFFLYLASRGSKEKIIGEAMCQKSFALLKNIEALKSILGNGDEILPAIRNMATNLDAILFAKELLERTLVYARYHAKALGGE